MSMKLIKKDKTIEFNKVEDLIKYEESTEKLLILKEEDNKTTTPKQIISKRKNGWSWSKKAKKKAQERMAKVQKEVRKIRKKHPKITYKQAFIKATKNLKGTY